MDELQSSSRWIRCPICGGKTRTKVRKETYLVNFPLYCPHCKKKILADVVQFKMVQSKTSQSHETNEGLTLPET